LLKLPPLAPPALFFTLSTIVTPRVHVGLLASHKEEQEARKEGFESWREDRWAKKGKNEH
jgi:hypothetical protein